MQVEYVDKNRVFKQRLYAFTLDLINVLDTLEKKDGVVNRLSDQLLRSGTSVIANYVEGLSGSSKKDLANFFNHSLKSCNESKVWICLLRDTKRMSVEDAERLLLELDAFGKIFGSSLITLRNKQKAAA